MVNYAQQIADAVAVELEGDAILVEAMARRWCQIYWPDLDVEVYWPRWAKRARAHIDADRIMRGPGDQMAYNREGQQKRDGHV